MLPILMLLMCIPAARDARGQLQIEWRDGPKLPMPLGGHSAVVMEEGIVVAGGTNWPEGKKTWRDEIWVLDPKQATWRQSESLPVGLTLSSAVVGKGAMMLIGGWSESGTIDDAFLYERGSVVPLGNQLPAPRAQAGAATVGENLFVVGGMRDAADVKTTTASVLRRTQTGWKEAAPLPKPLALASTISFGGSVYVFGGTGPGGDTPTDSAAAYRYDTRANRWLTLAPLPSARRGAGVVALDERYILLIGGCRNGKDVPVMLNEVLAYDTREDRYHVCTPLPFSALCIAAVLSEGKIYAIGGEDLPRHRTDRVVIGTIHLRR